MAPPAQRGGCRCCPRSIPATLELVLQGDLRGGENKEPPEEHSGKELRLPAQLKMKSPLRKCHWPSGNKSVWAALPECHRPGGSGPQKFTSHGPGGWRFEIRCQHGWSVVRVLFLVADCRLLIAEGGQESFLGWPFLRRRSHP